MYVDDIITGSDSAFVSHLIHQLGLRFVMKDLGNLHYFLGVEVTPTETGLFLYQVKYATEILSKAGIKDYKPGASPTSSKHPPDPSDPDFPDVTLYRSLVGSL